jgi:hypothetical protein
MIIVEKTLNDGHIETAFTLVHPPLKIAAVARALKPRIYGHTHGYLDIYRY